MQKIWLITGSSRGFGRENVVTCALDVTDTRAANNAVEAAIDSFGSLHVVVNNAGYAESAPIEEMTEKSFREQIETNLFGVVNVTGRQSFPMVNSPAISTASCPGIGLTLTHRRSTTSRCRSESPHAICDRRLRSFPRRFRLLRCRALRSAWR